MGNGAIGPTDSASGAYYVETPLVLQAQSNAAQRINVGMFQTAPPSPDPTIEPYLSLGTELNLPSTAGILFTYNVQQPMDTAGGYFAITQLISANPIVSPNPKSKPTPAPLPTTGQNVWDLDTCALETIDPTGSRLQAFDFPINVNPFPYWQTEDTPGVGLFSNALSYTAPESFRSYFMYKPQSGGTGAYPKTIWVSLGRLDWTWNGTTTIANPLNDTWNPATGVVVPQPVGYAQAPAELPSWVTTYPFKGSNCPSVP